jgi:hypothetical protein
MNLNISKTRTGYQWALCAPADGFSTVAMSGKEPSIEKCILTSGKMMAKGEFIGSIRYEQNETIDGYGCSRSSTLTSDDFYGVAQTPAMLADRLVEMAAKEKWKQS